MARPTYQHSNNIGLGLIVMPLGGFLVAAIVVALYVFSFPYLLGSITIALPVGGGAALGYAVYKLARFSVCRDRRFLLVLSLCLSALSFYSISALFCYEHRSLVEVGDEPSAWELHHPIRLCKAAYDIVEGGEYQRGRYAFAGWRLWLIWGLEGLVFIGLAAGIPALGMSGALFCETSRSWMCYEDEFLSFDSTLSDEVREKIAAGDLDALLALPRVSSETPRRFSLATWSSEKIGGECYYQVYEVLPDSKDRETGERIEEVTPKYCLSSDEIVRLCELS